MSDATAQLELPASPAAPTYAELEQAKAAMVRPWLERARAVIADRLADARAHAETGNLLKAGERMRSLVRDLAGTASRPEDGLLGEARGAIYRESFGLQRRRLDPEIHDLALSPHSEDVLVAQRHPIEGLPFHRTISDLEDLAWRHLTLASAVVSDGSTSDAGKAAVFGHWEDEQRRVITRRTERELKTAATYLYQAVGGVMLKPEHRQS